MEVRLKQGARVKNKPDVIFSALESIRQKSSGDLRPESVVEASKKKSAPLHNEFEWNDTAAAEQFRVEQARSLIRSIEVIYEEAPNAPTKLYSVVNVSHEQAKDETAPVKVYRTAHDILADPLTRDQLLARAIREAGSFMTKYANLSELSLVFDAIKKTSDKLMKKTG